jgi:hypothetical protein
MYTRKDYMDHKVTHEQYHAQFVTDEVRRIVSTRIGLDRIRASTDPHFNDIPLVEWDAIIGFDDRGPSIKYPFGASAKLKAAGDIISAASLISILKEAARQLKS